MIYNKKLMYYAFYKGDRDTFRHGFFSLLIKILTFGRYSHVELVFPDCILDDNKNCFSSRGMDNPKGVNFKKISFSHPKRWRFIPILWIQGNVDINRIYRAAQRRVGAGYDYQGVIHHYGLHFKNDDPNKWWCSEICAFMLGIVRYQMSPVELYRYTINHNKEYKNK